MGELGVLSGEDRPQGTWEPPERSPSPPLPFISSLSWQKEICLRPQAVCNCPRKSPLCGCEWLWKELAANETLREGVVVALGPRWELGAGILLLSAPSSFGSWQLLSCFLRLQDLSSGYWVLVVHFTRREAIKQIEVLQHVATNLGRSE